MTFLKRELDAVETELDRVRSAGGALVASDASQIDGLVAAYREHFPGRPPIVIVTGVPRPDTDG